MALIQNIPTLEQALDDVEARFLYNLPKSELEHTERLFFQIEQAYWFYEDFKADVFSNRPHFSTLKSFATKLFSHSALLSKAGDKFQELFSDFKNYKSKIPVFGVIMLNPKMTKAVLVCDYGSKSWTFPRGKINENESEFSCAVREVHEETGFDASPHCREEDHLVAFNEGKQIKMYVACNVPEATQFTILTRKEIAEVAFHPLDALPKSYAVMPFLEKLKRWIGKRRQANQKSLKSPPLNAVKSPARNNNKGDSANGGNGVNGGAVPPVSSRKQKHADKSPVFSSSSPNLLSLNHSSTSATSSSNTASSTAGVHPSPSTSKRMKNLFDMRNSDTFVEEQAKGWGVNAMFAANAKITGKNYSYDGNPHQFGASHPKYVNYATNSGAVSSRSVFGSSNSVGSAGSMSPTPMSYDDIKAGMYNMAGIASAYHENNIDNAAVDEDGFSAWAEQSLRNASLLRSDQPGRANNTACEGSGGASGVGSVGSVGGGVEFALPTSAFAFDTSFKQRHDSFDSTHSRDGDHHRGSAFTGVYNKVVFPVDFKLDRAAVMMAFDRALRV